MIQKSILEQIRKANFFSIMVDEVTSHNTEVMPSCIRFVDSDKRIREEFIQFSTLVRDTGEAIATQICSDLKKLDLDIEDKGMMVQQICLVITLEFKHVS